MVSSSQEAWVRLSYLIVRVSRRYLFVCDSKEEARQQDGGGDVSKALRCEWGLPPALVKTLQPILSAGKFVFIFLALATLSQLLSSQGEHGLSSSSSSSPSFLSNNNRGKSTLNHMIVMEKSSSSNTASSSSAPPPPPMATSKSTGATFSTPSAAALATTFDSGAQQTCKIPSLRTPEDTVIPVIAASFPGTGVCLLRKLTEAFTGFVTIHDSDYDRQVLPAQQKKLSVMVETAYPYHGGETIKKGKLQKTIVFLRNPVTAISALYQSQRQSSSSSSSYFWGKKLEGPDWITWRDANFHRELDAWSTQLEFWLDYVTDDLRHVLPMEKIVDPHNDGHVVASERLADFLGARVPVAPKEELPCLWSSVMKNAAATEPNRNGGLFLNTLSKTGTIDGAIMAWVQQFPLTYANYQQLFNVLLELKKQYAFDEELQRVLKLYMHQIDKVRWSQEASA